MERKPLISVLIPVYNAGEYLRPALLSIIEQTYSNLEIIIIDDGSNDGCLDTVKNLTDSRIQIISQANAGKAAALNRAISVANGDFFIIQDADDLSYPERVEKQLKAFENHIELAAVYVGNDIILGNKRFAPIIKYLSQKECKELINNLKLPAHDAAGMYRMSMIGDMRFDESLRIGQGVDFVLRVGERFSIMRLGQCLYSHRVNYNSITHQDPQFNVDKINMVLKKACNRRGLDFNNHKIPPVKSSRFFRHRQFDTILPYVMESVVDLRCADRNTEALKTAFACLRLHPCDPYYYKPLAYFLAPLTLIKYYRSIKAKTR